MFVPHDDYCPPTFISCRRLSENLRMPERFMTRIVQRADPAVMTPHPEAHYSSRMEAHMDRRTTTRRLIQAALIFTLLSTTLFSAQNALELYQRGLVKE